MNKIKKFLMFAAVAIPAVTFVSCEKDPDDDDQPARPTVALVSPSNNHEVAPNGTVTVNVLAAAPSGEKLKSFRVEFSQNGGPYASYSNAFAGGKSDTTFSESNFNYIKTLPTLSSPGTITYRFTATDGEGNTGSLDFKINVVAGASELFKPATDITLGNEDSGTPSFLQTSTGTRYSLSQANSSSSNQSAIDILHYFGAQNKATLAAPADPQSDDVFASIATWSVKNTTRFATLVGMNQTAYDNLATANDINVATATLTTLSDTKATQLAVGDYIGFLTNTGKRGVIHIKALSGSETTAGTIVFEYKVQK